MIVAVFGENRDSGEDDALGSVRTREPVPPAADVSELGESGSLSLPVEKGWVGRRPDGSLSILFRQHEQSILLGEWQRAEQPHAHDSSGESRQTGLWRSPTSVRCIARSSPRSIFGRCRRSLRRLGWGGQRDVVRRAFAADYERTDAVLHLTI